MKITSQIYWDKVILFFALVLLPISSTAGMVELIPGLRLTAEYDDNIDYRQDSSDAEDDFSGSAIPSLQLIYNTERFSLAGRGEIDFQKYLNETDFDRTNHLYEIQSEYQAHRRWRLSGDYSFRRDQTVDSQFEETGRSFQRRRAVRHDAQGSVQFALTELSDIGPSVLYRRADYSGRDNTDYDRYTVQLPYTKRFQNQRDTIRLTPGYTRYNSDDNEEADGYRLTLFWEHLLSETLIFDVTIGGRYTDVETPDGESNSNYGAVGNIGLEKQGETFRGDIRYSRDLGVTAEGEIVNVDRFTLNADQLLTERFGYRFTGNVWHSTRENDNRPNDKTVSFEVTPALYYMLAENHSVELAYSYRNQRELDEPGNPTTQRNSVALSFNFLFPQRWY